MPHPCEGLSLRHYRFKSIHMGERFGIEDTISLQEQRLLILRRQAIRGERYVIGQLKRTEREYFASKRRLDRVRRIGNRHEWKTSGQYDIESAV
jgi:hypothetical protein